MVPHCGMLLQNYLSAAPLGVRAALIAAHFSQALQPLQAPQPAQLPPQLGFPAFLSRIMLRIKRPVTSTMTAMRMIQSPGLVTRR